MRAILAGAESLAGALVYCARSCLTELGVQRPNHFDELSGRFYIVVDQQRTQRVWLPIDELAPEEIEVVSSRRLRSGSVQNWRFCTTYKKGT